MKAVNIGALIIAAVGLVSCSRDREEPPRTLGRGAPTDTAVHSPADSAAPAAPHGATQHQAAEHQATPQHSEHAAGAAAGAAGHQQHSAGAPARHAGSTHAARGHAAASHAAAAAGHGQEHRRDSTQAHAAHQPRADTSRAHAGHAAPRDTASAHAGHQMPADSAPAHAAHAGHAAQADTTPAAHGEHAQTPHTQHGATHSMPMLDLGGGWMALGMAQAFPTITFATPSSDGTALGETGVYLTQPAIMLNIESRGSRVVLRTTLNFEGITQPDGELTFGGWGEGFIDKRHPHTLLHEFMLSGNFFRGENSFSLSAGKGFAPYGTDDPMSRPIVKYPTNHHLSQALERWTVNGVAQLGQWSIEAGVFGGAEPTSPYDFSNIETFADSWSARVTRRFGGEDMGAWPLELSVSHAYIVEEHHEELSNTRLYNAAIRHQDRHGPVGMYALAEASLSNPQHGDGFFSILGEGSLTIGRHKPYGRIEYATRPEYERVGAPGTADFFRYHHDDEPIGATRWLILTGGYGFNAVGTSSSLRPYVEAQYNKVRSERGDIDPRALFGRSGFWSISLGGRIFLGGEAMRMGTYGILDPMTRMHKPMMTTAAQPHH